jgi:hypothetical protein
MALMPSLRFFKILCYQIDMTLIVDILILILFILILIFTIDVKTSVDFLSAASKTKEKTIGNVNSYFFTQIFLLTLGPVFQVLHSRIGSSSPAKH